MLEDRVPVAVQGQRDSVALDQALHEKEVTAGVLLLVEQRVGHGVGGIIYGQQQGEPGVLALPATDDGFRLSAPTSPDEACVGVGHGVVAADVDGDWLYRHSLECDAP